ncbi:hypothetical protein MESS2_870017 [Mesorhizobium metallidurans STM 2683]|uniref:Uncharacterized protein n=1 Tax=Mesorhizobium metallidurans STM 2683 TaxID=1297569 RepID=M5EVW8_9HYPH|nr:hypothetical protein MESS2_870017 [Mesorhizobium metallidurans STM 2683]
MLTRRPLKQCHMRLCGFCDTDFVGVDGPGGGHFATARELALAVEQAWRGSGTGQRLVVLTEAVNCPLRFPHGLRKNLAQRCHGRHGTSRSVERQPLRKV